MALGVCVTLVEVAQHGAGGTLKEKAWTILVASLLWFPLAGIACNRLDAMRRETWEFYHETGDPPEGGRLMARAKWLEEVPTRRRTAVAIAAAAGGVLVFAFHHAWGVTDYYPWPLLNLLIGASGGIVLAHLVGYVVVATAVYRDRVIEPLPDHPDGYGGWGQLSEHGNSLVAWLFTLVLVGNLFYLSANQVKVLQKEDGATGREILGVAWPGFLTGLSILSTAIVLVAYLLIHMRIFQRLAANRRECVDAADRDWRALREQADQGARAARSKEHVLTETTKVETKKDEPVKDGTTLTRTAETTTKSAEPPSLDKRLETALARLKAANEMQVSPAGVFKSIQLGALATAVFTAFVTALVALLGENAGELFQAFLPEVNQTATDAVTPTPSASPAPASPPPPGG